MELPRDYKQMDGCYLWVRRRPSAGSGTETRPPSGVDMVSNPMPAPATEALTFLLLLFGGWVNRRQQKVIDYLKEENRVLRELHGDRCPRLTDDQRKRLAVKGKTLGRKVLSEVAGIVTSETILRWYRKLIAQKYDGSKNRGPGRPRTSQEIVDLVITMSKANPSWGVVVHRFRRIAGDPKKHWNPVWLPSRRLNFILVLREGYMSNDHDDISLPKEWPKHVQSAIVHVIALARTAIVCARAKEVSNSPLAAARLRTKLENARAEISLLREELRIKDARMATLEPRRRPHYRPTERQSIVELRAARGWSLANTARVFLVQPATIASWCKRIDEQGESSLVQTPTPVNKFPEFVQHLVCRLKVLNPTLGKKRIAQILARAGLHMGVTTVKRMLEQGYSKPPKDDGDQNASATGKTDLSEAVLSEETKRSNNPVTSKYPDHLWQVDLTLVPTATGFWVPWLPFTLPQRWPFCWWVACVIDHFSRRVIGFAVFAKQPTSVEVRSFLGRAMSRCEHSPKYIVSDLGPQFDCDGYRSWCKRKGIQHRYSSAGSLAATAVIERYFKSLKEEMLNRGSVPMQRKEFRALLTSYIYWYNEHRPHQGLAGRTPIEVNSQCKPANEKARIEPRPSWPRKAPCAQPPAAQRGKSGRVVALEVRYHDGDSRLPVVELRPAA